MTEKELRLVQDEPRIFAVDAVDDEGVNWTVWERTPSGPLDTSLRGWAVNELVRYQMSPNEMYRTMPLADFVKFGLPGVPHRLLKSEGMLQFVRDELTDMASLRDRPFGDAKVALAQACLSMTQCVLRGEDCTDRAYLYAVASLGASVYELTRRMLAGDRFESCHDYVREILTMANGLDEYASSAHEALLEAECE